MNAHNPSLRTAPFAVLAVSVAALVSGAALPACSAPASDDGSIGTVSSSMQEDK
jgi:hypothetical protein